VQTDAGDSETFKVGDKKVLEGFKAGDKVEIVFTEALIISVK
jgi:Cu/Ag efflux protein CusF